MGTAAIHGRVIDTHRLTTERKILLSCLERGCELRTAVRDLNLPLEAHGISQNVLGPFSSSNARKSAVIDTELITQFKDRNLQLPDFFTAGPRPMIRSDYKKLRAAIATTGGLAPGLHCVIHSIVKRHTHAYPMNEKGKVFGVYNSFEGLCSFAKNHKALDYDETKKWLEQGGSKLGSVRYYPDGKRGEDAIKTIADKISENLRNNNIDILYVIGGDSSLKVAHEIADRTPTRTIVGIPKTMDNDILWVKRSFGFDTAVEQATRVINTMRNEAEATRRICLIDLFGAESGFVAANATLASGHADAVLIPEVFCQLDAQQAEKYLLEIVGHIGSTVQNRPHTGHAVVVLAEGVGAVLEEKGATIAGQPVTKNKFVNQFSEFVGSRIQHADGKKVLVTVNQPQHLIRAVPANAHDQIYCSRLGALAVDAALAGFTDFMITQWLGEYSLVPLTLVSEGKKGVPIDGMFWKQVVNTTGQPISPAEELAR